MPKTSTAAASAPREPSKYEDWRVDDAMHTLMRAKEIEGDAKMRKLVRKKASEHASKMKQVAADAERLARAGHISDKQLAKLKKEKPIASGKEGDTGKGQTIRGVATK